MKRIVGTGLGLAAAMVLLAPPGGAQEWSLTPTGFAKGSIEHVRTVPFETGTAVGGTVHDGYLYVTTWRSFSIYDVSAPLDPKLVSITPLPGQLINEGPSTNGEVLLLAKDAPARRLQVWDVGDKAAPVLLAEVAGTPGNPDHIWACVLDCTYAYGSGGTIVDLRAPATPKVVGNWRPIAPFRRPHGIAEAEPGVVFLGTVPQYVLDARTDPANPSVLVTVEPPTTRFTGALGSGESPVSYQQWPRGRFAFTTLETPFSGPCNEVSGGLVVYDTAGWEESGTFRVADVHRITEPGLPSEGLTPANAIGCSALALDAHPRFRQTRSVAVGWAENGLRVFSVDKRNGTLTETAGFIAHGTEAFAPIWADEDVLYVVDTARGLDVFRVGV